jgi:PIN domain nuclease of toxin-antitoxin system
VAGIQLVKLLLDTHIFIWAFARPNLLKKDVTEALKNQANELWLSPITVWEAAILAERGRITLDRPYSQWIDYPLTQAPFTEALLNHQIALKSREIMLPHQDPADRFLVATALIYDLVFVTADKIILDSKAVAVLSNL